MEWTVEAVKIIRREATIVADTPEEAHRIADEELITDDFREVATEFAIVSLS